MKKKREQRPLSKMTEYAGKHDSPFEGDKYGHGNERQYEKESSDYNNADNYKWGKKADKDFTPYKNKGRGEFASRTRTRKSRFD